MSWSRCGHGWVIARHGTAVLAELAASTRSEIVQRIGHVALFYRANLEKTTILLPDA